MARDPALRIVDYDPAWPDRAAAELAMVGAALGPIALRLDHVGSTAVPGLAAKPIVDLQVSVATIAAHELYEPPLTALGYLFVPDPDFPDLPFFGKPSDVPRAFHVHVCEAGSHQERRHLVVRDFLRAHPAEHAPYVEAKRRAAAARPRDGMAYNDLKNDYVTELEARALGWAATA